MAGTMVRHGAVDVPHIQEPCHRFVYTRIVPAAMGKTPPPHICTAHSPEGTEAHHWVANRPEVTT